MALKRREFIKISALATAAATAGVDFFIKGLEEAIAETEPERWVKGVCRYCGVGCGTLTGVKEGKVVAVKGDPDNPCNRGLLCIKGVLLPAILYAPDRAMFPLIKKEGKFVRASWNEAFDLAASKFKESIAKYGPDSVAYYGSAQSLTEESYIANKLFKAGIGTNNVEANARLCMASAAAGYISTYGKDEPMGCYEDIDFADCFFFIGSNPAECHPVIFQRVAARKARNPNIKIIIADPRKTISTKIADLHLSFVPGTDLALLNSMAQVIFKEGLIVEAFIKDNVRFQAKPDDNLSLDDYRKFLESYSPESAEKITGVSANDIRKAALMFAKSKETMSMWTMGVNQRIRGTALNNLIHNLHLITGKIGRPGSTPFSLTGQSNACGGIRDTGTLSHLLPAGRLVAKKEDREEMERLWGLPPGKINPKVGLPTINLFKAIDEGKIKAIFILCTNPGQTLPNLEKYRKALQKEEVFVAVSEAYHTSRTAELADVIFPAALWVEKEGVYGNAERRYQFIEKAVDPPGEAKPDSWILMEFTKRLGYEHLVRFKSTEDIWNEWRKIAQPTTYNFYGMTYARLKKERGLTWPIPTEDHPGTKRRYVRGDDPFVPADSPKRIVFYGRPDKRAIVWLRPQEGPAEPATPEYPFILTTGRVLEHFHTGTMTLKVPQLKKAAPDAFVEINPKDAASLGIQSKDMVRITSRRGNITLEARVVDIPRHGVVFVPFHYPDKLINLLTIDSVDPISNQPEFKICAVKISKT